MLFEFEMSISVSLDGSLHAPSAKVKAAKVQINSDLFIISSRVYFSQKDTSYPQKTPAKS